jgi:hypothetical protein
VTTGTRGRIGLYLVLLLTGAARAFAAPADTAVVGIPMRAGDKLETVLAALNARGFRITYSDALVRPDMKLRATPPAMPIDELLRQILAPWRLRAVRAPNGDWLIALAEPAEAAAGRKDEDIAVVDVTATRMRLAVPGASNVFLDRKDVERIPHLADDALRMLKVLPGVSGGDFSAALNIRGGRREEALLTIDGAEIHNAFHFRDIDGALSVLDTNLVEGIDFITGGMTADVGDYMSGVVGLQTRRPSPADEYRHGVGISFVSAYGRSSGTFAADRGSWLMSARRGFLDVLTERVVDDEEQLTPRYTDVFAAVSYELGERTVLDTRFLLSDDDLKFLTDDEQDDIDSAGKGHSMHLWFTLDHAFSDALRSRTLLSAATVRQARDATGTEDRRSGTVHSDNEFRFFDLRQEWSWESSGTQMPRWGFNLADHGGDYDYALLTSLYDPLITPAPIDTRHDTRMGVDMRKAGLFAAWRTKVTPRLTAELGARWDNYRYGGGLQFDAVSPRLNAVYAVGDAGELRAAWGVMHQPQAVNELQVEDGVTRFFAPERVRQAVIGYSHRFARGLSARLDVYDKAYGDLRPRFDNALDPVQLIPEGAADRVRIDAPRARARGVELTLRRAAERGLAGWLSLGWARAEDFEDGEWRPRGWEQRQSLSFGGSWTAASWSASLAGLYHSGTPTTSLDIDVTPLPGGGFDVVGDVGPRNGDRLRPYSRVDLRVNRDVSFQNGKLSLYVEVTNLFSRSNDCCIEDYRVVTGRSRQPELEVDVGSWLPMLPSLGVQFEF